MEKPLIVISNDGTVQLSPNSKYYIGEWYHQQGINNATEFLDHVISPTDKISEMATAGQLDEIHVLSAAQKYLQAQRENSLFSKISKSNKIYSEEYVNGRVEDLLSKFTLEDLNKDDSNEMRKLSALFKHIYLLQKLKNLTQAAHRPQQNLISDEKRKVLIEGLNLVINKKVEFVLGKAKNESTLMRMIGFLRGFDFDNQKLFEAQKQKLKTNSCQSKLGS